VPDMTDEQLREYATTLILEHARSIEFLSIFEMAEEHTGREISDKDADRVDKLLVKATITVSFPDTEGGGSDA
jgi:hypothetical protein